MLPCPLWRTLHQILHRRLVTSEPRLLAVSFVHFCILPRSSSVTLESACIPNPCQMSGAAKAGLASLLLGCGTYRPNGRPRPAASRQQRQVEWRPAPLSTARPCPRRPLSPFFQYLLSCQLVSDFKADPVLPPYEHSQSRHGVTGRSWRPKYVPWRSRPLSLHGYA